LSNLTIRKICPICNSKNLFKFLERKHVPVHQNLLYSDANSAVNAVRGDLNLAVCFNCGFVFNQTFDLSKLSYGEKYDNTQDISPYFNEYLSKLANQMISDKKIQNCKILEIGCGKGTFLRKLVKDKTLKNIAYGFDPSYVGPIIDFEGRLQFFKKFYDKNCTSINANVIISRHVIEHIPDPLNLLQLGRKTLEKSSKAQIFFETPSINWILQNQVIYDFFYEHCSYFSADSLTTAFEKSGFRVKNVHTIFEDQYLWLEAITTDKNLGPIYHPGITPSLAQKFSNNENIIKTNWLKKIHELFENGKVAIWGAGAKGVTFANLIDPQCKLIDSVIDLNDKKQGKYLAGTGHPIVNFKEIPARKIKSAIMMNPNYFNETLELLKKNDIEINLMKT